MGRAPDPQTMETLVQNVEREVRGKMKSRAVKTSFFGAISVDPNEVYVSKERAERSMRVLEDLRQKRDLGSTRSRKIRPR